MSAYQELSVGNVIYSIVTLDTTYVSSQNTFETDVQINKYTTSNTVQISTGLNKQLLSL